MASSRRIAAALVGGCLLAAAFLVGAHWVDVGDGTCGGVYRLDLWLDRGRCRGRMLVRTGGVFVLISLGAVLLGLAARRSDRQRTRPDVAAMEEFSKPEFWIWMGVIFGANAVAAALLGAGVLAVFATVTGFSALLTAAVIGRNAVRSPRH